MTLSRTTRRIIPALAHHFDSLAQQSEATTLGMWVFLVTEVLFFGGLFATYMIYRNWYPDAFAAASHELDVTLGTVNTVVLITSSLTMALAVHAAQLGQRKLLMTFLILTMIWARCSSGSRASSTTTSSSSITYRARLPVREGVRPASAAVLLALLRHDRAARAAHDHRHRHHAGDAVVVVERHHYRRSTQPDRDQRPLLALRRYRLDLPVSRSCT
jgi:cytochrome c oxidase subunit 3